MIQDYCKGEIKDLDIGILIKTLKITRQMKEQLFSDQDCQNKKNQNPLTAKTGQAIGSSGASQNASSSCSSSYAISLTWLTTSPSYPLALLPKNSFNFWGPSLGQSPSYSNKSLIRHQMSKKRKKSCQDSLTAVEASLCCTRTKSGASSEDASYFNASNYEPTEPQTMLDLAAKMTARHYSGHLIDERLGGRVPEPVQKRLLFWAFPNDEHKIQLYSTKSKFNEDHAYREDDDQKTSDSFVNSESDQGNNQDITAFSEGLRCYENSCVNDVMQIGYLLTGTVCYGKLNHGNYKVVHVALSFDRCKITSVLCSCDKRDIYWCHHAVALAIFRIRRPESVKYRFSLSDGLLQLDRDQLQKLVQYLIAKSYRKVDLLPLAQHLIDDLMINDSKINRVKGAPDLSMGLSLENTWYFDESQVRSLVRSYLTHSFRYEEFQQIFGKVREMLKLRDENGSKLLLLITEEFLCSLSSSNNLRVWSTSSTLPHPPTSNFGTAGSTSTNVKSGSYCDRMQDLWDEIGLLWVCVVLNPKISSKSRDEFQQLLKSWMFLPNCPNESTFSLPYNTFCEAHAYRIDGCSDKCIFSQAYEACQITWRNFDNFCANGSETGNLSEPLYIICARIESLKTNGFTLEALKLAIELSLDLTSDSSKILLSIDRSDVPAENNNEHLQVGHTLDPVGILFNCLLDGQNLKIDNLFNIPSNHFSPNFLRSLAVEIALILLCQPRPYTNCRFFKEKMNKQEGKVLERLFKMDYQKNECLYNVVKGRASILLAELKKKSFDDCIFKPNRFLPLYNLAYFMFKILLNRDPDLAYDVGLTVLRNRLHDEDNIEASLLGSMINWPGQKDSGESSIAKSQESNLASNLIIAAKDDPGRLKSVLIAIRSNTVNSMLMCQLAYNIYNESSNHPDGSQSKLNLLNIAFELGLEILKASSSQLKWCRPNVVRWIVNCAISLSLESVLFIVRNWSQYFTPVEAVSVVARAVWTENVNVSLKLDSNQRMSLCYYVQEMALECAMQSPTDCGLHALSISFTLNIGKNNEKTFEAAFQIIAKSGEQGAIGVADLFNLAQHMERLMLLPKAYQLSLVALRHCRVGYLDDNCASTSGVYWTVTLAKNMGRLELNHVIRIFCDVVRSPVVLTNIFKICVNPHHPSLMYAHQQQQTSSASTSQYVSYCRYLDKQRINLPVARSALLAEPNLHILLDSTITAYIESVHGRLSHISPRHYCEFIDFLYRARDVFSLADNGDRQFAYFIEHMKILYKGKKKLLRRLENRDKILQHPDPDNLHDAFNSGRFVFYAAATVGVTNRILVHAIRYQSFNIDFSWNSLIGHICRGPDLCLTTKSALLYPKMDGGYGRQWHVVG
uniref:SWIM-type domain-containing protein n=1 Tax=Romanomermis culicivorax TaxID=13658 RepID=A0A915HQP4_ROMCU